MKERSCCVCGEPFHRPRGSDLDKGPLHAVTCYDCLTGDKLARNKAFVERREGDKRALDLWEEGW